MKKRTPFVASELLLTVLHTSCMESVPAQLLVKVGEIVGFSENAVRAALLRLVRRGKVESRQTGHYQIVPSNSAVSQHAVQWRLGEKRRVAWNGDWAIADLPRPAPAQAARNRSLWVLGSLGFRRNANGLWLRPNNLAGGIDSQRRKLEGLGLETGAQIFRVSDYAEDRQLAFETQLWPIEALNDSYEVFCQRLEAGYRAMERSFSRKVLVNAFVLGNEVIAQLTNDPLLPDKMQDPRPRVKLTRQMLEFDMLGKRLWEKAIPGLALN